MSTEQGRKHRSLEKTERLPSQPASLQDQAPPSAVSSLESVSDTRVLKDALAETERERDSLKRAILLLETEAGALRSDFTAQKGEQLEELKTLHEVAERAHSEASLLKAGLKDARAANKALKAQNLSLQHVLNQWGVPIESGESSAFTLAAFEEGLDRFFPKLAPGPAESDPVPTVLKGELASFYFPDLLHFLSNKVNFLFHNYMRLQHNRVLSYAPNTHPQPLCHTLRFLPKYHSDRRRLEDLNYILRVCQLLHEFCPIMELLSPAKAWRILWLQMK